MYYQGLTWETIKLVTLKNSETLFIGRSQSIEPSTNDPEPIDIQGTIFPFSSLHNNLLDP